MPPGPDGVWAAERMRDLDPELEIVMVTAYSDINPAEIALRVPPPEKLLYVQKPFHAEEIRHFAAALGAKWRAQRFLMGAQRELEKMVAERTTELAQANAALETVVRNRDEERTRFERQIILNVQRLVRPHLEGLAGTGLDSGQRAYLEAVEAGLDRITSPLAGRTSSAYSALTPKEIEVAKMIRAGRTSNQIAEQMRVTPAAVKFHRNRIREKFGLKNRGANLRSFLLSLDAE
jgi:DNA-binding CsgD family transcriptional regulator